LWDGNALRKEAYIKKRDKDRQDHSTKRNKKYNVGEDVEEIVRDLVDGPQGWYSNSMTYLKHQNALLLMGGIRGNEESEESNFIDVWLWHLDERRWERMHCYGARPDVVRQHEILVQETMVPQVSSNGKGIGTLRGAASAGDHVHSNMGTSNGITLQKDHELSAFTRRSSTTTHISNAQGSNNQDPTTTTLVPSTKLIMFGGHCGYTFPNPVYILDVDTMSWIRSEKNHCPMRRFGHSMHWMDQQQQLMVVFGGCTDINSREYDNTTWMWNAATKDWCTLKTKGQKPAPRYNHSSCVMYNRMFVYGGNPFQEEFYTKLHLLDFESLLWVTIDLHQPVLGDMSQVSSLTKQYSFMHLIYPTQEDHNADEHFPVVVFFDVDGNEIILSKRISMTGKIEQTSVPITPGTSRRIQGVEQEEQSPMRHRRQRQ